MTSHLKPQKRAGIQPGTATVPLSRMIPPPDEVRASTMPFDPRAPFLAFGSVWRSRVNAGVSPIGLMSSP